jgi:hypothetical protein
MLIHLDNMEDKETVLEKKRRRLGYCLLFCGAAFGIFTRVMQR